MTAKWEVVTGWDDWGNTERLRVDGGWIYRTTLPSIEGDAVAMVFVPLDPVAQKREQLLATKNGWLLAAGLFELGLSADEVLAAVRSKTPDFDPDLEKEQVTR